MKIADDERLYDIGALKDDPTALYDIAVLFQALVPYDWDEQSEIFQVFRKVYRSLWGNLPQVVVHDMRDPDDPETWGEFGSPADYPAAAVLPELFSMQKIAEFFSVSKSTVSRWVARGVLPVVCIGGRRYVRSDDLCAAVRCGTVGRNDR